MLIKTATKQDVIHTLILLAIALGIGIYLIATTVAISKDGVTFLGYAKSLEVNAVTAMLEQEQHPGYPAMILGARKITGLFVKDDSICSWIYSAQSIAMMFRLLAIVILYFIGKKLVGAKFSFWSMLILILLPEPAKYGSDALSDWPHIFFLAVGMLLLMRGAISKKWWLFGFAGFASGAGYLVRPECIQIIVYGLLWLTSQFFCANRIMSKSKTALALVLLFIGFCAMAGPYIGLKGAVFPKKKLVQLQPQVISETTYIADIVPSDIAGSFLKLCENIGETLMWVFVPMLFIGLHKAYEKQHWYESGLFFITSLGGLNVVLMTLLYCKYGYMSNRHTLPLVVFTSFYIPTGLYVLADLYNTKFLKKGNTNLRFIILIVVGIVICIPKLIRPLHQDKQIVRKLALWIAKNTEKTDIIAVPDLRISFYADRKGVEYNDQSIPKEAHFTVKAIKNGTDTPVSKQTVQTIRLFSVYCKNKETLFVIYSNSTDASRIQ